VVVQGGSTLTQQLMKNFFLTDERQVRCKVQEAVMAVPTERRYSKNEILRTT
jgi:penicillin-binding protein 1B